MKFIVQKSVLQDALTLTGKCIGKNVLVSMESYLFIIDNAKMIVVGSNLEVTMEKEIDIESDIKTRITMPKGRLTDLVKDMPEQPLQFTIGAPDVENTDSMTVELKSDCGIYKIQATNARDYSHPEFKSKISFTLSSEKLFEGINKTLFACAADALRPAMCGVLFSFADRQLTLTATNANVLSTYSYDIDVESEETIVVPAKVLNILSGLVPNTNIGVDMADKAIIFHVNNTTVLKSRLIDEKYPDYKAIIPQKNDKQVIIRRPDLLSSLNRVTQFCDDTQSSVKLEIGPDKIDLSSQNVIGEMANETMDNRFDGDPTSVRFNGRNLIGCLKSIDADELEFSFYTPEKAFLIRSTDDVAQSHTNLMLLMPLGD